LETLEEIAERGRESFLEAGGEEFTMIPCLNTHPMWVEALSDWVNGYNETNRQMILEQ
jgi:ferrochelatase